MIDDRESNAARIREPLDFEKSVYGSFQNFIPRHYVFDGFESHEEFTKHLRTLLDWQVES